MCGSLNTACRSSLLNPWVGVPFLPKLLIQHIPADFLLQLGLPPGPGLPQLFLPTWQARSAVSHTYVSSPNSHHTWGRILSHTGLKQNSVHSSKVLFTVFHKPPQKQNPFRNLNIKYVQVCVCVHSGLEGVWEWVPLPILRGSTHKCSLVKPQL